MSYRDNYCCCHNGQWLEVISRTLNGYIVDLWTADTDRKRTFMTEEEVAEHSALATWGILN